MDKPWRKRTVLHQIINYCIAAIWLINGLYCKILDFVPRHQQIVARILGEENAFLITKFIGIAEVLMAIWVLSYFYHRFSALFQIIVIGVMNVIELIYAKDLLLWGRWNAFFAVLLMLIIFVNEFVLAGKPDRLQVPRNISPS